MFLLLLIPNLAWLPRPSPRGRNLRSCLVSSLQTGQALPDLLSHVRAEVWFSSLGLWSSQSLVPTVGMGVFPLTTCTGKRFSCPLSKWTKSCERKHGTVVWTQLPQVSSIRGCFLCYSRQTPFCTLVPFRILLWYCLSASSKLFLCKLWFVRALSALLMLPRMVVRTQCLVTCHHLFTSHFTSRTSFTFSPSCIDGDPLA